jgi:hypothetical protein
MMPILRLTLASAVFTILGPLECWGQVQGLTVHDLMKEGGSIVSSYSYGPATVMLIVQREGALFMCPVVQNQPSFSGGFRAGRCERVS